MSMPSIPHAGPQPGDVLARLHRAVTRHGLIIAPAMFDDHDAVYDRLHNTLYIDNRLSLPEFLGAIDELLGAVLSPPLAPVSGGEAAPGRANLSVVAPSESCPPCLAGCEAAGLRASELADSYRGGHNCVVTFATIATDTGLVDVQVIRWIGADGTTEPPKVEVTSPYGTDVPGFAGQDAAALAEALSKATAFMTQAGA